MPLLLVALFTAAFLIRVWGLSYFHTWDEWVYLQDGKVICCGKTNYSELPFRPPLLPLVFAASFLIRDHMFSACIAAAGLNALGPVFLFLAGRRIVGRLAAALAAVLLAFGPFFVGVFPAGFDSDSTGNSLMTDSPALTLLVLALWLMVRALERQRMSRFAVAGFALALAVLMRFGSIPCVAFLLLLPLMAEARWRALGSSVAGLGVGLAPYLMWSRMTYGGYLETIREGWSHVEGPAPPFTFYLTNFATTFTWMSVAGLLVAAGVGVVRGMHARGRRSGLGLRPSPALLRGFLWAWAVVGFLFFSLMPHKEPRYVMPAAAPVLLLAGFGLARVCKLPGRRLRPLGAVAVTVGMVAVLAPSLARFRGPLVVTTRSEEMEASQFLESQFPADTPLYMNFNYPAFAYLTDYRIHELPVGGAEVYRAIGAMPEGALLIAYRENESGEPKIELLDRDAALAALKRYGGLVIYRRVGR